MRFLLLLCFVVASVSSYHTTRDRSLDDLFDKLEGSNNQRKFHEDVNDKDEDRNSLKDSNDEDEANDDDDEYTDEYENTDDNENTDADKDEDEEEDDYDNEDENNDTRKMVNKEEENDSREKKTEAKKEVSAKQEPVKKETVQKEVVAKKDEKKNDAKANVISTVKHDKEVIEDPKKHSIKVKITHHHHIPRRSSRSRRYRRTHRVRRKRRTRPSRRILGGRCPKVCFYIKRRFSKHRLCICSHRPTYRRSHRRF